MLFKKILALTLTLVLAVSLLPAAGAFGREPLAPESQDRCCSTIRVDTASPNYTRPAHDGKLIEITPQRVEDHFRYLDEVYIERYPEAALVMNTGTEDDREMLEDLAEIITAGCKTDTEKTNAIDRWIPRNIYYDVETSAYASDTFLDRTGNCLSYANLMQYLLRSLGIPAVVGDGWRGDMKTSTVDLFNMEGHAWCFVHLNGEWVLYDPLWLNCGTTDRDYIAEWIYLDTIEFITPCYDGENLPPEAYAKPKIYYTDGTWYNYNDGADMGYGNFTQFVNNQGYNFTTNQDEWETDGPYDGWVYMDGRDETSMQRGEVYRDGWISYGDYATGEYIKLTYAHHNGMQIDGAVMEYDDEDLLMVCNTAFPILADDDDYTIQYGTMTFQPGYTGPFVGKYWGDFYNTPDHFVVWESDNPDVVTVDENGIITAKAPGWATIKIQLVREDVWEGEVEYAYLSTNYIDLYISDVVRVPDYSDKAPCEHIYELNGKENATCTGWGYEIHICTLCDARLELMTDEPLGHVYTGSTTPSTCVAVGCTTYTCSRCGDSYAEELPIDPEAHAWEGTECTLCGDTRLTPFDDVKEESFYEEPVAWAVAGGITNGASENTFNSDGQCLRAQVVTFLYRAAQSPTPESDSSAFTDVKSTDFFYAPVLWAVENGITNGVSADRFGSYDVCNRAAVVTFLWRTAGKPEPVGQTNPFSDVKETDFFYKAVLWAVENGITNGIDATHFGPNSNCNRAQVVTFLYRAFGENVE